MPFKRTGTFPVVICSRISKHTKAQSAINEEYANRLHHGQQEPRRLNLVSPPLKIAPLYIYGKVRVSGLLEENQSLSLSLF